ncbi:S-layer homology domain-containing protein [Paenibacillus macerans]|uniref:S-layer homology domain-containing protein n=1 Tax=Paenibacillus macerans TaxID=44252 RepID=UPI002DBA0378|nr:S-layer homology domain-containing protein [Paenibacillus macerans]MEC0330006.1 S-layer homology domain-containing protein [Paenibacillus macerans]
MKCEKKLNRIRRYLAGLLAVWLFCMHSVPAFADRTFNDIEHSYAADAIEAMAAQGYVTGYKDGSFRPLQLISRQEWASIFAKTLKRIPNNKELASFRDVSPWALPYVQVLQEESITKGIGGQLFGAKHHLTRQDMAVWYARYFGVSENTPSSGISSFVDRSDISDYAQTSVWLMEQLELIEGDTNHYFHPKHFVTRQDATLVAYRVWLGGDELRERAKRLLDSSGNEAAAANQPASPPEPNKAAVDLAPEISGRRANPQIAEPRSHSPRPDPPAGPVIPTDPVTPTEPKPEQPMLPPGSDPKPPVTPPVTPPTTPPKPPVLPVGDPPVDFVADEVVIKAPELVNQPETYPSYQLSFQLYKEGRPVSIPAASVTNVTYAFSDELGVFDEQGKIAHAELIPAADSFIPVGIKITVAKPYQVLTAQTKVIVKGKAPPVEDPSVIKSVYLATYTIPQSPTLDPAAWSMPYVFQNAKGEVIPPSQLPSDLKLRIEDSRGIFDEDGHIANLHLIPAVNSVIPFKIEVESPSQGIHFISDAELTVVPGERQKQYFAVSLMLQGQDPGSTTTVEQIEQARQLLMDRFGPNIKVTWAMENRFVFVETNRPQLKKVLEYVDQYGDEVGILDGYPNNLYELPFWELRMNEWLYMYRYNALNELHQSGTLGSPSVFESMDTDQYRKYLPKSLTSFTVNPEQTQWLKDHFKITSAMGWSATQYNVNGMYGEGSPLMPYWSNKNNPMVPAQGFTDNSGTVFMNSITIDPIGSRYTQDSSRWTLHPGDPYVNETDAAPQLYIAQQYLDNPFQRINTVNYMSIILDINWLASNHNMSQIWENFVNHFPIGREVEIVGVDGLKQIYESSAGSNNDHAEFTLMFRGSGIKTAMDSNNSPANLRYLWTENASQRIILSKEDGDEAWSIIDFTDYTRVPVPKTPYNLNKDTDVSYVTGRNFKLNPTAPLTAEEIQRIKDRLKEIYFAEEVNYQ